MLRHASKTGGHKVLRWTHQSTRLSTLSRHFSTTNKLYDEAKTEVKGIPYSALTVGIPKETFPLEKRVAATPEVHSIAPH